MIDNIQLVWFSLCFLFLFLEMGHPGLLYFLSFSFGSVGAFIASCYDVHITLQLMMFLGGTSCALISIYFLTKENKHKLASPSHRSNLDALIGNKVIVYQSPQDEQVWLTKLYGQVWVVKNVHNEIFVAGQQVIVVDVQGCHLRVDKITPII